MRDLLLIETRPQTLARHLQQMQHDTGKSLPAFAQTVAERYEAMVTPERRTIHWHTTGDAFAAMRANAQMLRRYLDGEHRFPAELEEAFVSAMPEPWHERLRADLARRYGMLPVLRPQLTVEAQRAGFARLFKEVGEAGEAVAEMLGDGKIGPEDMPHLDKTLAELDDVVTAALSMQAAIRQAVTGKTD